MTHRSRPPRKRRARLVALVAVAALGTHCWLDRRIPVHAPIADILHAIRMVETGDRPDPPDGDGGLAIGPYQIHEVYWRDALASEPSIGGTYQDCRDRAYAERVIRAYMLRHAPDAWASGDAEIIARTHNGGPSGPDKASTAGYWERVRAVLQPTRG